MMRGWAEKKKHSREGRIQGQAFFLFENTKARAARAKLIGYGAKESNARRSLWRQDNLGQYEDVNFASLCHCFFGIVKKHLI